MDELSAGAGLSDPTTADFDLRANSEAQAESLRSFRMIYVGSAVVFLAIIIGAAVLFATRGQFGKSLVQAPLAIYLGLGFAIVVCVFSYRSMGGGATRLSVGVDGIDLSWPEGRKERIMWPAVASILMI